MTQPSAGSRESKADRSVLVIGVGNPDRGDDGAGAAVVRRLSGRVGPSVRLLEMPSNLTRLVDEWGRDDMVVLVDATRSRAAPGTVRHFDATAGPLPARAFRDGSTHGFGVAETIELARALGRLPRRLIVIGIEGRADRPGEGLTPAVGRAVEAVAERVIEVATCAHS